jgi:hypothetical protein
VKTQAAAALIAEMESVYTRDFVNVPNAQPFEVAKHVSVAVYAVGEGSFATLKGRHVVSSVVDWTRSLWIREKCKTTVGIMAGSSGSGKTVDCLLVAEGGLCVRLTPTAETLTAPQQELGEDDATFKARRNAMVETVVMDILLKAIPEAHRRRPLNPSSPLVVLCDEFGRAKEEYFVRALCALRGLRDKIRKTFLGGADNPIYILAAGTGVEGTNHAVGSEPSTFTMISQASSVWTTITDGWGRERDELKATIAEARTSDARLVRQLVTNARCAALYDCFLGETLASASRRVISTVAERTAARYRSLNGLQDLGLKQYFAVVLEAMAAQTSSTDLPAPVFDRLARKYGLLRDRAVRDYVDPQDPSKGAHLTVAGAYYGVRYELEPAQTAMLQLTLGLGDRESSGEGFEQVGMDFIALCASMAEHVRDPSALQLGHITTALAAANLWTALPAGWHPPLYMAQQMLAGAATAPRSPQTAMVALGQLPHRVVQSTTAADFVKWCGESTSSEFIELHLNQDKAAGFDVLALTPHYTLLVQCKRYLATPLSELGLFQELYKLGLRTPSCIAAEFVRKAPPASTKRQGAKDRRRRYYRGLPRSAAFDAKATQSDMFKRTRAAIVQQGFNPPGLGAPLVYLPALTRRGKPIKYVVMTYGVPPCGLSAEQLKEVADDVWLIAAAPPATAASTDAAAAQALVGYYPCSIGDPAKVRCKFPLAQRT